MNTIGELLEAKGIFIMTTERKAQAALLTSPPITTIVIDEEDRWSRKSKGPLDDMETFHNACLEQL